MAGKKGLSRLIMEGNRIVGVKQGDVELPLYNAAIHRAGDKVLVRRGKRLIPIIIPELDGDGQPVPW